MVEIIVIVVCLVSLALSAGLVLHAAWVDWRRKPYDLAANAQAKARVSAVAETEKLMRRIKAARGGV